MNHNDPKSRVQAWARVKESLTAGGEEDSLLSDGNGAEAAVDAVDPPIDSPIELPIAAESLRRAEPRQAVEPIELAHFPEGFWQGLDYLLRHPERVMESLRRDHDLWKLATLFLTISLVMSAAYGAVLGATNLLQGAPVPLWAKIAAIWITAVKVPALFLLTLAIVLPPVYVSNAFGGARLPLRQMTALLLAAVTITVTILASMATVAFFFSLTSRSYHFIRLLHVMIFSYAGIVGLVYLTRTLDGLRAPAEPGFLRSGRATPQWLFIAWLLLYMFVGTQLAWLLRPFVGDPQEGYRFFCPREGNFYEAVFDSMQRVTDETTYHNRN